MINTRTYGGKMGLILALITSLALSLPGLARATEFRGGDTVVISADEVIDDDLFVTGSRVEMNGTVRGDLFAAAQEVIINGTVEGSAAIAGQTLAVPGQVDGSLYASGYALTVSPDAEIGRNAYFAGFSLTAEEGSIIGRDVYMGGYQAILKGEVADDVSIGGAALELHGAVGGDVTGTVGDPERTTTPVFMPNFPGSVPIIEPGLRVADGAIIGGNLNVEETAFATEDRDPADRPGIILELVRAVGRRAGEFIALLIVGGLLLRLWPGSLQDFGAVAEERPLPSAGWGCLVSLVFAFGVPFVAIVIFLLALLGGLVTFGQLFNDILGLGAASLGLIVTLFLFVASLMTKAVVALLVGRLILDRLGSQMEPGYWKDFTSLALGALIYEVLRIIPLLGWILAVIVTLVGLGAIFFALRTRLGPAPAEPAQPSLEATT